MESAQLKCTLNDEVQTTFHSLTSTFGPAETKRTVEAIEQVALGPVALMILDLNMPDMHGVDVLRFIRRHGTSREVPVVVLTTRGDDASRDAALSAGATQYMTKPFVPQTLLSAARDLLERPVL